MVVSNFNYFEMHAWSTSMLLLLHSALKIYAQRGEDAAERGGWRSCIK